MKIDTSYGVITLPILTARQKRKLIEWAIKGMAADTMAIARHKHRRETGIGSDLPEYNWQSHVLEKITSL